MCRKLKGVLYFAGLRRRRNGGADPFLRRDANGNYVRPPPHAALHLLRCSPVTCPPNIAMTMQCNCTTLSCALQLPVGHERHTEWCSRIITVTTVSQSRQQHEQQQEKTCLPTPCPNCVQVLVEGRGGVNAAPRAPPRPAVRRVQINLNLRVILQVAVLLLLLYQVRISI